MGGNGEQKVCWITCKSHSFYLSLFYFSSFHTVANECLKIEKTKNKVDIE